MSIPHRIISLLKLKKLKRKDFCDITGYSQSNLSNYLTGKTSKPQIDLIQAFADYFPEISINWLMTGKGEMLNENAKEEITGEEDIDPEKGILKDELLSMYKRRVTDLEREIKTHCKELATRLELE